MWLRGLLVVSLWTFTIFTGFFVLYAPLLPLLLINHTLYRLLTDQLFSLWQLYPVALFQCVLKCRLHHYGDVVRPEETCIIIMNHRTRVDWNYAWIALYHATVACLPATPASLTSSREEMCTDSQNNPKTESLKSSSENTKLNLRLRQHYETRKQSHGSTTSTSSANEETSMYRRLLLKLAKTAKLKYVLKDEIKMVPAIGWIMQLNYFLFLRRNWNEDQSRVDEFLEYYRRQHNEYNFNYQLLLFPEGTDLSRDNRRRSDAFAAANNLQVYDFVLHPRTTGFAVLCSRMRDTGLAAVYDVTLAYDVPPQTEFELLRGHCPNDVYVHFKRYDTSELPRDEERLRRWLTERWRAKEAALRHFHNHGTFSEMVEQCRAPRSLHRARYAFVFWSAVDLMFLAGVLLSSAVRFWITYNVFLFAAVTWYFGGFHRVQNFVANYLRSF